MNPWQELRITTYQPQHQPMDSEPADARPSGMQQVTHPRVVWISLLHLDAVCGNPGLTSMEVLEFWFAGRYWSIQHLDAWIVCISASMSYSVCIPFLEEYSVNNTLLVPSCVCQALLHFSIEGNSFSVISMVDLWMVGDWARGYLTQAQLVHHDNQFQNSITIET